MPDSFHSIMKRFDIWLRQYRFILESETIFQDNLAENAPLLIIAFIMSEWVLWLLPYDTFTDQNRQM
jgi:hypothetical protein